jgi:hypothetical protein
MYHHVNRMTLMIINKHRALWIEQRIFGDKSKTVYQKEGGEGQSGGAALLGKLCEGLQTAHAG